MANWAWLPAMGWLPLGFLAIGLACALAVISLRSSRRLWPTVGFTLVALAVLLFAQGPMVRLYSIGCGLNCGGIVYTDAISLGLDAVLVAGVLSLLRRSVRPAFLVSAAAAASFAFLSFTIKLAVA